MIITYYQANIYINGIPSDEVRTWFLKNSGYVMQLSVPYHEELTVRQNITYSAIMKLPMRMSVRDKLARVEQVLGQVGVFRSEKYIFEETVLCNN